MHRRIVIPPRFSHNAQRVWFWKRILITTLIMTVKLTLLGTGTPSPLCHRAGSSYLVRYQDQALLFDCGPGAVRRLLDHGVSPTEISSLFLTHLHYDHCMDYAYLVLSRWDQGAGQIPELSVYGPPPTTAMTERLLGTEGAFEPDILARTEHPLSQFVYEMRSGQLPRVRPTPRVTEVGDGDQVSGDGWRVRVLEVVHAQPYIQCLAYRLELGGQVIVFSGDTAPNEGLVALAEGANVLIHMCHFVNKVVTDPRMTGSCSGHLDAARTAQQAGVSQLVLVHISTQVETPGVRERVVHEAAQIFGGQIFFGEDLLELPLNDVAVPEIR